MKEVTKFSYEASEVRVVRDENREPWFVAQDICAILDISRHRDAADGLDEDERGRLKVDTLGGPQEMVVISESGLYTLIIRSNKSEAKKFKRWVTHKVLPSLRRHGHYLMSGAVLPDEMRSILVATRRMERTARIFKATLSMAKTAGIRGRRAIVRANAVTREQTGFDCLEMLGAVDEPDAKSFSMLQEDGREVLRELVNAEIQMKKQNVRSGLGVAYKKVRDITSLRGMPDDHEKALEEYGLKVTKDGLFIHPPDVCENLLKESGWGSREVRKALCTLPHAQPKITRLLGVTKRGVLLPLDALPEGDRG